MNASNMTEVSCMLAWLGLTLTSSKFHRGDLLPTMDLGIYVKSLWYSHQEYCSEYQSSHWLFPY